MPVQQRVGPGSSASGKAAEHEPSARSTSTSPHSSSPAHRSNVKAGKTTGLRHRDQPSSGLSAMKTYSASTQNLTWRVTVVLVAGLALLLFLLGGQAPTYDMYGVMIDAGSTGSRIHVFHFTSPDPKGTHLKLQSEVFHAIKPGLSSYASSPQEGAKSLVPLLNIAAAAVPKTLHPITPVNLKATAGLRLLKAQQAEALLQNVKDILLAYNFLYDPEDAVEVMSGTDEGLFGWMTVNYLMKSISHPPTKTAVILDLGGGSTQIAMSVDDAFNMKTQIDGLREAQVMGNSHLMYLYSHLGFGLLAGRAALLSHGYDNDQQRMSGQRAISSPCVSNGVTVDYEYGDRKFKVVGDQSTSAVACVAHARGVMSAPGNTFSTAPKQPDIVEDQPIFAMSYYLDRAQEAGIIPMDQENGQLRPTDYLDAAKSICGLPVTAVTSIMPHVDSELAPFMCMDLCFIYSLLTTGFGVPEAAQIILARKLSFNGELVETQWPLGASLEEITEELEKRLNSS